MVSQARGGAVVRVLREDDKGAWAYVETDDTYRGWAETRHLTALPDGAGEGGRAAVTTVFAELRAAPDANAPLVMRLPCLATVETPPVGGAPDGWRAATLGGSGGWLPAGSLAPLAPAPAPEIAKCAAGWGRDFLGTPYLWGGSSSFGLDCSGFAQICYRLAGIILRRDADIQRSDARFELVVVREIARAGRDLSPGDLVFFGKPDKITHVGMHLENNAFIHSAGGIGVTITEWGDDRYSPGFVDARRLNPVLATQPVERFEADDR